MQIERVTDAERGLSAVRVTLVGPAGRGGGDLIRWAPAAIGVLTSAVLLGAVAAALLAALVAGLVATLAGFVLVAVVGALFRQMGSAREYHPDKEHEDHCW